MERETRFELATLALARRCSTTELLPLVAVLSIPGVRNAVKPQSKRKPGNEWKFRRPCRLQTKPNQAVSLSPPAQSPRRAWSESDWR
jgi:hypothetical protein